MRILETGPALRWSMEVFDYSTAFSRNLGLVTKTEQLVLQSKRVAIAGLGGVGGSHLETLARMGIQNFHIADMDHFELGNINRQAGAKISTIDKPKTETMKETALDINPDCDIQIFPEGVARANIDEFLDGVDLYVDGLDVFVMGVRRLIFQKCREKGIPAITAGPMCGSTAFLVFNPNGVSFEDYFDFPNNTKDVMDLLPHFLVGLSPRLPHRHHIVAHDEIDFAEKKVPSLAPACYASSAVVGMEALKLLLGRGKIYYAPWALQFDMYNNRFHKIYNWLGNRNSLNKLKIWLASKLLR